MSHIIIAVPGEIPRRYLIPDGFTYRELNTIKSITGLRPADFEEALATGDPGIVISLAVICAGRAGHKITAEDLLDLEVGSITVEGDDDADPTLAGEPEAAEKPAEMILADGGIQP